MSLTHAVLHSRSLLLLAVLPDRANLAGVTNRDVAASATAAMSGTTLTTLQQGNQQIPVIARLRAAERAQLSDVKNLYVYSSQGAQKIPLRSVSSVVNEMTTERIRRQEHFRTIGVHAFPVPGVLSSEVLQKAMPQLTAFGKTIPPGYRMEIGGERAKQQSGFANLAQVLAISLLGIYGALLLQFGNAVKPLLVFAATPYGVAGALVCLAVMGSPFGFMAFLGIASLIGVIVSHVIVLFDFIEEMHQKGEPFEQAIRDAGIERLRPVLLPWPPPSWRCFRWRATVALYGSRFVTRRSADWLLPLSSPFCSCLSFTASPCWT